MVWPTFCMSALSCGEGGCTVMPFLASVARYSLVFCSETCQPRFSASATALSSASCVGLSSAAKAFLLTTSMFLGSHASTA
ncbi:hypothetical protein D3C80_1983060 [compost metagenome]